MASKNKLKRMMPFDYVNYVLLLLFCVTILFPMWDMLVRSLSSAKYSNSLKMMLWPKEFTLDSYKYALSNHDIFHAYGMTVLRTLVGTVVNISMTILLGYPLSKKNLPGRNLLTAFFLFTMFFGGGLIPSYLNNRSLGLVDNFWIYILPGAVSVYNGVLMRNYFMGMDAALEESAFMDGAGYARLLLFIIIPLSTPIIATIGLWDAVGHWNAWFDCMIYIRSKNLEIVQIILRRMQEQTAQEASDMLAELDAMLASGSGGITSNSVRMATTIITMIPILCVYPFIQKYFVKGIMIGSLKG